jgi:hypothetical protein
MVPSPASNCRQRNSSAKHSPRGVPTTARTVELRRDVESCTSNDDISLHTAPAAFPGPPSGAAGALSTRGNNL